MAKRNSFRYYDAIYGECELLSSISGLVTKPAVQRLREVRQSNIDSLGLPGFANCSRYEHSLGTAYLASHVPLSKKLTEEERLSLAAAALLHDSAISPFGHLVEEAFAYLERDVCHEDRWKLLLTGEDTSVIGGIDLQLYLGRQSGILEWAESTGVASPRELVSRIVSLIRGETNLGKVICGELDLDNIDNVVRAAFHAGIEKDCSLPERLIAGMVDLSDNQIIFAEESLDVVQEWLDLRKKLYEQLMFNKIDFIGKAMLLHASVEALETNVIRDRDWILTDREFLSRLIESKTGGIAETVKTWLCADVWPLCGPYVIRGQAPRYGDIYRFSKILSESLNRSCFGYRIKDKRRRTVNILTQQGKTILFGEEPDSWLIGIVSKTRKKFTKAERSLIESALEVFFGGASVQPVTDISEDVDTTTGDLFSHERNG